MSEVGGRREEGRWTDLILDLGEDLADQLIPNFRGGFQRKEKEDSAYLSECII